MILWACANDAVGPEIGKTRNDLFERSAELPAIFKNCMATKGHLMTDESHLSQLMSGFFTSVGYLWWFPSLMSCLKKIYV